MDSGKQEVGNDGGLADYATLEVTKGPLPNKLGKPGLRLDFLVQYGEHQVIARWSLPHVLKLVWTGSALRPPVLLSVITSKIFVSTNDNYVINVTALFAKKSNLRSRSLGLGLVFKAIRTKASHFDMDRLDTAQFINTRWTLEVIPFIPVDIQDFAAAPAYEMMMGGGDRVKTHCFDSGAYPQDSSLFFEQAQIAIDGVKRDSRYALANPQIDSLGVRMLLTLYQFAEYLGPLMGCSDSKLPAQFVEGQDHVV